MVLTKYLAYSAVLPATIASNLSGDAQDPKEEDGVLVSTISEDTTVVSTIAEQTVESTTLSVDTVVTIPGTTETISLLGTTELATHSGTTTTFSYTPGEAADTTGTSLEVVLTGTTVGFTFSATSTEFTLTESTTAVLALEAFPTKIQVGDTETDVTIDGTTTTVTVDTSTAVTLSLDSSTAEFAVSDTTVTFLVTTSDGSDGKASGTTSTWSVDDSVYSFTVDGTTETVSIDEIVKTLSAGQEIGITIPAHVTTEVISAVLTTISLSKTETNDSTSANETMSGTSDNASSSFSSSSSSSSSTQEFNSTRTTWINTATCQAVPTPLTPEENAMLGVLFEENASGSSTYAEWLAQYLSSLSHQIDNVAAQAMADAGRQYTTMFTTLDIADILGLASAAPMYTCYLSSLWTEALANPQQYAKRAVPTQDENIKLIVLFEKRNDGSDSIYNLAGQLVDETEQLVSQIEEITSAASANPAGFKTLFSNLNAQQLLSIASEAPIYTEGLSAAFASTLDQLNSAINSTSTTNTTVTRTSTTVFSVTADTTTPAGGMITVETIITPTVYGESTIYQTSLHTLTLCIETVCIENPRASITTITVCEEVCASLYAAAESAARTVTVTSCETNAYGLVANTVVTETVCDIVCESLKVSAYAAASTRTVVVAPQATKTAYAVTSYTTTCTTNCVTDYYGPAGASTSTVFTTRTTSRIQSTPVSRITLQTTNRVATYMASNNTYSFVYQTHNGAAVRPVEYWFGFLGFLALIL